MRSKLPALTLALAALLMVLALSLLPDSSVVARTLVALPLALVLPGYALVSAIFPEDALDLPERLTLTVGLSLLISVVGGILLDWTPWGLRPGSWTVLLGGITLLCCFVRLGCPRPTPDDGQNGTVDQDEDGTADHLTVLPTDRLSIVGPTLPTRRVRMWRTHELALFALAVIVTIGTGRGAIWSAQVPREGFSQLWMLPLNGDDVVRVRMRSEELAPTSFTLQLIADDATLLRSEQVQLQPGAQWETSVALADPADVRQVEARLYRADDPREPYRRVLVRAGIPPPVADADGDH